MNPAASSTDLIRHSRPTGVAGAGDAVARVIDSGEHAVGHERRKFEQALASRLALPHVSAVQSGSAALHIALLGLQVGAGDAVLCPSYVCVAVLNAVTATGAKIELVDGRVGTVHPVTEDYVRALDRVTARGERVGAAIVVHQFGFPAELPTFPDSPSGDIPIVEDCATAIGATAIGATATGATVTGATVTGATVTGATVTGATGTGATGTRKPAAELRAEVDSSKSDSPMVACGALGGRVATYSFYATKMISTGHGGAVATRDIELHARIDDLLNYDGRESWCETTWNYRLPDTSSAMGSAQLTELDRFVARRREISERYREFCRSRSIEFHRELPDTAPSHYRFTMFVDDRDAAEQLFAERGIEVKSPVFRPLHEYFPADSRNPLPEAHALQTRAVSLPCYPSLTEAEVDRVLQALEVFCTAHTR